LRDRRILHTHVMKGRRRSESEKSAIDHLQRAAGRFSDLEQFLGTQGLRLLVKEPQQLGLPGDGLIYIAIRDATRSPPEHVRGGQILQSLASDRRSETVESTVLWGSFFTLLLLYFLYTREGRPIESVSGFRDSAVDSEEFLEEAARRIEELRAMDCDDPRRQQIKEVLTGPAQKQLDGRVRGFLAAMMNIGLLELIEGVETGAGEAAYRQTLWSAVEIAENFRRYGTHLIGEDIAEQMSVILAGDGAHEEREEIGDAPLLDSDFESEDGEFPDEERNQETER